MLAGAVLYGCATSPDPAVVCSAEWIAPRADEAVELIEDKLGDSLSAFADVGESRIRGRSPGPIELLRLSNAAKSLEQELKDGRGIRDLRTLATTCDDPELIRSEILSLLGRQQLPERITEFLAGTGILDRIIAVAEGLDAPASRG
ncbi:MAG: hypothetical protein AAF311_01370 [Pseudomonadota bacterium]